MFFDRFKALCDEGNISCSKAAAEIGLSNSIATKWKKTGATPDASTLAKVAKYFDVSIAYLLEETDDSIDRSNPRRAETIQLNEEDGVDENYLILSRNAKKLSPEQREQLINVAKAMFTEDWD